MVHKKLFFIPYFGRGIYAVWKRNLLFFRHTWMLSVFWIIIEPLIYLFAFGLGIGALIKKVDGIEYFYFFFPALLANTSMMVPFFENTYSSFTKLTRQKTFSTILLTPISVDEIMLGEILWGATKGLLGVLGVCIVAFFFNLIDNFNIIIVLFILMIQSWVFAAFGLFISSIAKSYDYFVYFSSGFIVPLSLFCGTYFPLSKLPFWLSKVVWIFPITHTVRAVRELLLRGGDMWIFINILVIIIYGLIFTNLAISRMRKKLIT